jgi:hypothetical protein
MQRLVLASVMFVLWANSAAAQTSSGRFYAGASTGAGAGTRGPIFSDAVPTAGGLVGVRLTGAWSIELELDRGFHSTARTDEAVWVSFAPPNSTREEILRLGVLGRFERTKEAGTGFAVQAMWRSRERGRVNVGLFAGVSARNYSSRVVRTTLFVPPEANVPPDWPELQRSDEERTFTGGGPTGGLMIFVRVTPALTIAPEVRYTHGIITDDPYRVFRTGVRAMWGF